MLKCSNIIDIPKVHFAPLELGHTYSHVTNMSQKVVNYAVNVALAVKA